MNIPLIIAHRGVSAQALENSPDAFRRVRGSGADGVEFDVHSSRDGIPVVLHDFLLGRVSCAHGPVGAFSFSKLKKVKLKNGESLPDLSQVLSLIRSLKLVNIEIKSVKAVMPVVELLAGKDISRYLFSSFRWRALELLRKKLPQARIGLLMDSGTDPWTTAHNLKAESIHPHVRFLSEPLIRMAHKINLNVLVYGVRTQEALEKCLKLGVDGVFADDPALAREAISCRKGRRYPSD